VSPDQPLFPATGQFAEGNPPPLPAAPDVLSVEYRRLRSFGSFENETIGGTARVPPGEDPAKTLEALRSWVEKRFGEILQVQDLRSQVWALTAEKESLERAVEEARRRWESAKGFLGRHGVQVEDPVPF
jgi:hypothetical protein